MRWLDGITDLMDMSLSKPRVLVMDRAAWRALPFGPRSQASLQKAQGPGVCKLPKGKQLLTQLDATLWSLSSSVRLSMTLCPLWVARVSSSEGSAAPAFSEAGGPAPACLILLGSSSSQPS